MQHDHNFEMNSVQEDEFFLQKLSESNKTPKQLRAEAEEHFLKMPSVRDITDPVHADLDFHHLCRGLVLVSKL